MGISFSVEDIEGSAHGDHIIGNGQDNYLTGGAGDDVLEGYKGNDRLGVMQVMIHSMAEVIMTGFMVGQAMMCWKAIQVMIIRCGVR